MNDAGNELPYVIERPSPAAGVIRSAKSFQVSLKRQCHRHHTRNRADATLDGVTLESPAASFIKSVQIEASTDARSWEVLARDYPSSASSASKPASSRHSAGAWRWLRLSVDDQRSQPIPFTARVSRPLRPKPCQRIASGDHHRAPREPGRNPAHPEPRRGNLNLAAIRIETPEPLFTRPVTLRCRRSWKTRFANRRRLGASFIVLPSRASDFHQSRGRLGGASRLAGVGAAH